MAELSVDGAAVALPLFDGSKPQTLEVGDTGYVKAIVVAQVLSDNELLGKVGYEALRHGAWEPATSPLLWISGFDTTGVVDDAYLGNVGRIFRVVGTKRYDAADGATRTVFELQPINLEKKMLPP